MVVNRSTTMGARGGSGSRGSGGGGGAARSVSGVDRYGQMQTFTLEQHMAEYNKAYAKLESERGEIYRKQAAAGTTAQLQQLANGPSGESLVRANFAEKVKLAKSGNYDINIANPKDAWVSFESPALKGLIHNIAKQELARRRRRK